MSGDNSLIKFSNIVQHAKAASFQIDSMDLAIVNALRRTILADIPNASMFFSAYDASKNYVSIAKNTSAIHNEMVGHRMSLVPVCLTENQLNELSSNPNKYQFTMNVKNTGSQVMYVTTRDIVVMDSGARAPEAQREAFFPADSVTKDHILLLKLRPNPLNPAEGEEISLDSSLALGTAKQHAAFSPVSVCYFVNKVDPALVKTAFAAHVEAVNAKRAEDNMPPLSTAEVDDARRQFDALEAKRCFARTAQGEPTSFEFTLESECRMRPAYIFMKACMVLHDKVVAIKAAVQENDTSLIQIAKNPTVPGLFQVSLMREGHTLGNLLQSLWFNRHVRDSSPHQGSIDFIGYHQPHPLEDYVYLKLKMHTGSNDKDVPESVVRQFLEDNLQWCSTILAAIAVQWYRAAQCSALKVSELDAFVKAHGQSSSTDMASACSTIAPVPTAIDRRVKPPATADDDVAADDAKKEGAPSKAVARRKVNKKTS
jgi:DNA-directed RNA polymerase subunit L